MGGARIEKANGSRSADPADRKKSFCCVFFLFGFGGIFSSCFVFFFFFCEREREGGERPESIAPAAPQIDTRKFSTGAASPSLMKKKEVKT